MRRCTYYVRYGAGTGEPTLGLSELCTMQLRLDTPHTVTSSDQSLCLSLALLSKEVSHDQIFNKEILPRKATPLLARTYTSSRHHRLKTYI